MHQDSLDLSGGFREPRLWSVEELQGEREFEFRVEVLHEKSFSVYFSNQGIDRKPDPLYNKRRVRGGQHKRHCTAITQGGQKCGKETHSAFGVCEIHRKDVLEKHAADWVGHFTPPPDLLSNLDEQTRQAIHSCERLLVPMHGWLIERLLSWSKSDENKKESVNRFMQEIVDSIPGRVPDATSLQETLLADKPDWVTPDELVEITRKTIDNTFPYSRFQDDYVPDCVFTSRPKQSDMKDDKLGPLSIGIRLFPVRVVATLVFLAMISEEANRGDAWFRNIHNLGEAERAGAHFAYTVYVLRKEDRMSITQISKLLQVPPWE